MTLRPQKSYVKSRRNSMLATIIPFLLVVIAAITSQLLHNAAGKTWVSDVSNTLVIVSTGLLVAAIFSAIGFAIAHKNEIAKGIGFGICIDFVMLAAEWGLLEWLSGV